MELTEEQIKIGNELLEYFVENDGQLSDPQWTKYFKAKYPDLKIKIFNSAIAIMIDEYGLLKRHFNVLNLKTITRNGLKAYKIGLIKFIEEFEEKENLEIENLRANIKTAKRSQTISIIALIVAVFAPILAALVSHYIDNTDSLKSKNNDNPQNNIQNIFIGQDSISKDSLVKDSINIY